GDVCTGMVEGRRKQIGISKGIADTKEPPRRQITRGWDLEHYISVFGVYGPGRRAGQRKFLVPSAETE
ncbi:hypothetical protein, partial [Clostridioides difficile]|uniref:hypothetical protein n=1 Tax=Clostridioides difficile TaxID=1496 RepID=UPI001A9A6DD5